MPYAGPIVNDLVKCLTQVKKISANNIEHLIADRECNKVMNEFAFLFKVDINCTK